MARARRSATSHRLHREALTEIALAAKETLPIDPAWACHALNEANPDRLVVCLIGDGAFSYNPVLACFGLAQEYEMPFLTVILNNQGYKSQQNSLDRLYPGGFGVEHGPSFATSITPRPAYPKLIEVFGGWGMSVEKPEEIVRAIRRGIQQVELGRPALVEILLGV